jgi:hypothetical protein
MLSQDQLKLYFRYDAESGDLYWRDRPDWPNNIRARFVDKVAGALRTTDNYIGIGINGRKYLAHHIVWCYVYGYWPSQLDHKDGNGFNNRLGNLRLATQSQNGMNKEVFAKGYEKHGRKYRARLKIDGRKVELGSYDTEEEAKQAYLIGTDKYYGEYSVYNRA